MHTKQLNRVAIIGTAPSWRRVPWDDPSLHLMSLNDAYQLGFPRCDEWYDIHPLNRFHFADGKNPVYAHQVPPGYYVRPAGHLEWLSQLQIPLWVSRPEDHTPPESYEVPALPHVHLIPKQEIEAHFGCYFSSTPAWMLAHAILRGAKEVHVYGIHLSTQHEYIEQRPNFEFLLGRVLGPGRWTETRANGLRRYQTDHGLVVLPEETPILTAPIQYGYQTRPRTHLEPIQWQLHKAQVKRDRVVQALKTRRWWMPYGTLEVPADEPQGEPVKRMVSTGTLQDELWRLDALVSDYKEQMQRVQMEAQVM